MIEDDLPVFNPERRYFSDEEAYQKAIEMMKSRVLSTDEMVTIWSKKTPSLELLSNEKQELILKRISSANRILPLVEQIIYGGIARQDPNEPKIELDKFVLSKVYSHQLGVSQREYQIAAAQVIFKLFARTLSNCPGEGREDWYTNLLYFGAVHDFLVGIKTGDYYFLYFVKLGEEADFGLIEETVALRHFADEQDIVAEQLECLLDDEKTSPIKRTKGGVYSIASYKSDLGDSIVNDKGDLLD